MVLINVIENSFLNLRVVIGHGKKKKTEIIQPSEINLVVKGYFVCLSSLMYLEIRQRIDNLCA